MKKILVILFAVFYFTAASGVTVHMHYCMGRLVSLNLWHKETDNCSKCGMKKAETKNCCKDEHKQLKIEKTQKFTENIFQFKQFASVTTLHYPELPILPATSIIEDYPLSNAPPRTGKIPVFIFNCSYLI